MADSPSGSLRVYRHWVSQRRGQARRGGRGWTARRKGSRFGIGDGSLDLRLEGGDVGGRRFIRGNPRIGFCENLRNGFEVLDRMKQCGMHLDPETAKVHERLAGKFAET